MSYWLALKANVPLEQLNGSIINLIVHVPHTAEVASSQRSCKNTSSSGDRDFSRLSVGQEPVALSKPLVDGSICLPASACAGRDGRSFSTFKGMFVYVQMSSAKGKRRRATLKYIHAKAFEVDVDFRSDGAEAFVDGLW